MDDFFPSFLPAPEPHPTLPATGKAEIQAAIDRVLVRKGILTGYKVELVGPIPTANPYVQRVEVEIAYEKGVVPPRYQFQMWIDDYELVFRFSKRGRWV
jgi:hypothetical protein